MTPKITLDNFQLMGDGITYWLEGFDIEKIGGKNVLKQGYLTSKRYDDDSIYGTGFSNLEVLKAFDSFIELDGTKQMVAFSGDYLFMFPAIVISNAKGEIHQRTIAGSSTNQVYPSSYPDIKVTREGDILYTSANHLGIGWYGKCKTGSGTTATGSTTASACACACLRLVATGASPTLVVCLLYCLLTCCVRRLNGLLL